MGCKDSYSLLDRKMWHVQKTNLNQLRKHRRPRPGRRCRIGMYM